MPCALMILSKMFYLQNIKNDKWSDILLTAIRYSQTNGFQSKFVYIPPTGEKHHLSTLHAFTFVTEPIRKLVSFLSYLI